jgi:isopentenyldiphosphate isomerase/intracellular septation protein A
MHLHNRTPLLLLPGTLPLLVFTVMENSAGAEAGILSAVAAGTAFLFISYLISNRFEWFILIDIALLIILGGISLVTGRLVFFLSKPVVTELFFTTLPFFVNLRDKSLLFGVSRRFFGDVQLSSVNPFKITFPVISLISLCGIHMLLVMLAVVHMNFVVWGLLSGILFPLIPLSFLILTHFTQRKKAAGKSGEEFVPLVDETGRVTGRAKRSEVHFNPAGKLLHPVVHLHVFNREQELFLQKRPEWKEVQPGKWDTAVGGHVSYGDTIERGLRREALEELGIRGFKPVFVRNYLWETEVEKELVYMFYALLNEIPSVNTSELAGGRFWTLGEIRENLEKEVFTPNFIHEFLILETLLLQGNPDRIS